jgi:lysophospholipase L1-like esterase
MRIYILLIILSVPCSFVAQELKIQSPLRYLALGDSYTIGQGVSPMARWPEQLADSLALRGYETESLRVIATTGWRTDNLINAVRNQNLEDENYNLVSVLIGVNNQYQSRPFSQYVTEFPALVDSAIRYAGGDRDKVFIVSIPDYAYTPFGQQSADPAGISLELEEYNAFSQHIADSMQITYFDITPISRLGLQNPSYVAGDGLHPSGVQYTEWVKLMLDYIDQHVSGTNQIREENKLKFIARPNPTTDYIHIDIEEHFIGHECVAQVFTQDGNLMMQYQSSDSHFGFSIAHLPDDIYLLEIRLGGRQDTIKIVKCSR